MNGKDILTAFSSIDLASVKALRREIIALVLTAAFSYFSYRFIYLRNRAEMKAVDERRKGIAVEIEQINAGIKASEELRKTVAEAGRSLKGIEDRFRFIRSRLPSDRNISKILRDIAEGDLKAGLKITSIKPLVPEEKGELMRLPMQITMEARFISFGEYLERIENLERLMIVDNFMIEAKEKDTGTHMLTSQMYLGAYIMGRPGEER
ncbi:MAG: type 4a pilus biogenesis protein PilO [Deltaproteobacteria bacterium]|nr:type 4a pilus biogenesis protein PilO [Deltaproteobacteria bacterium]